MGPYGHDYPILLVPSYRLALLETVSRKTEKQGDKMWALRIVPVSLCSGDGGLRHLNRKNEEKKAKKH